MTVNKYKFLSNSFLLLVIIYFSQGFLYPSGSALSQTTNFLILAISSFYAMKSALLRNSTNIVYCLIFFITLITFSFLLSDTTNTTNINAYSGILLALLPFFPLYYISYKGKIDEQSFKYFIIIMLIVAIARYYNNINDLQSQGRENIVANSSYLFVLLIPYIFLLSKKKLFYYLSIFVITIFIIQGSKRGALFSGAVSLLILLYYQFFYEETNKKSINYIMGFIGLIIIIKTGYQKLYTNEYFISRLESTNEGNISGRDVIYSNLWNNWYHADNILNQIFGFGFNSTIEYSGMNALAHNDWLEILTNFGVIGVLTYLLFFILVFKVIFNNTIDRKIRFIMLSIITIWLLRTIFSMSFNSFSTMLLSILMGYVLGTYKRKYI